MSPVDRLAWLRDIASTDAPGCALRVAAVLAWHANGATGESRPGLRSAVGLNVAKRGGRWLRLAGWVKVKEDHPGKAVTYYLTRVTVAPGAITHPVQARSGTRVTSAPGLGSLVTPEQGHKDKNKDYLAERRADASTQRIGDTPADPGGQLMDQSPVDGGPAGPVFMLRDGSTWRAQVDFLATLGTAFPNADLDFELAKAAAWCAANPAKRKTKVGMTRFLNSWLTRSPVRGVAPTTGTESGPRSGPTPSTCDPDALAAAAEVELELAHAP
jgi:hypothetical protein